MTERTGGLRALLSRGALYQHLQDLLGSRRFQRHLVEAYVAPRPGMRLLDIGCGTGALVEHLPAGVAYHGFDPSARYVAAARRRWGQRGRFWRAGVADAAVGEPTFDRVTAVGVLHHLDDATATLLAVRAATALGADGVLITYDPAVTAATSPLARFLLDRDRGAHVRSPERYVALLSPHFAEVEAVTVSGHLRVPYTGCVLTARRPRG